MKGGSTAEAADSGYKGYDLLPSGTHLPLVWQLLHWQEQPGSQFEQVVVVKLHGCWLQTYSSG